MATDLTQEAGLFWDRIQRSYNLEDLNNRKITDLVKSGQSSMMLSPKSERFADAVRSIRDAEVDSVAAGRLNEEPTTADRIISGNLEEDSNAYRAKFSDLIKAKPDVRDAVDRKIRESEGLKEAIDALKGEIIDEFYEEGKIEESNRYDYLPKEDQRKVINELRRRI